MDVDIYHSKLDDAKNYRQTGIGNDQGQCRGYMERRRLY